MVVSTVDQRLLFLNLCGQGEGRKQSNLKGGGRRSLMTRGVGGGEGGKTVNRADRVVGGYRGVLPKVLYSLLTK